MSLLAGLRGLLGLEAMPLSIDPTATAAASVESESLRKRVVDLETRIEGLLDVGADDPDAGLAGDQNASLFRQMLSGSSDVYDRDFTDAKRRRIVHLAHMIYALRGSGENLVETHLDFLLGDRITPKADQKPKTEGEGLEDNTELQELLDEIWRDPRNRLPDKHEDYSRALVLEGELVLRADLSPVDGHLETAFFDPLRVTGVVRDTRGRDAFLEIDGGAAAEKRRLFVLDSLYDQVAIEPWPEDAKNPQGFRYVITETTVTNEGRQFVTGRKNVHGLAFFWGWNRPEGARRGRSELTSVIDMIDAEDEHIWALVDTQNIRRNFLLHVTDPKIRTPAEAKKVLTTLGLKSPPKNPKVLATNDKVEVEFKSHAAPESESWLAEELATKIFGSKGMPVHWSGRAPKLAGERGSDTLPLRRLRRKQARLLGHWKRFLEVSIELRRRAGITVAAGDFCLEALEVGGKDKQRGSEVLKSIAAAIVQVSSVGGLKPELANWLFVTLLRSELGLEVSEELAGLPEGAELDDLVDEVAQLVTRKSRTGDEEDSRDRTEEKLSA